MTVRVTVLSATGIIYLSTAYSYIWCFRVRAKTRDTNLRSDIIEIQHYVIQFVSNLRQTGRWFSPGPSVSSTNKTDHHDINEILLKVALSTNKQTNKYISNLKSNLEHSQCKQIIVVFIFEIYIKKNVD